MVNGDNFAFLWVEIHFIIPRPVKKIIKVILDYGLIAVSSYFTPELSVVSMKHQIGLTTLRQIIYEENK